MFNFLITSIMKKRIIILASVSFVVFFSLLFFNPNSKFAKSINLDLVSIEALAQGESGGVNWWYQPETKPCKLELGGGMFTGSVQRVCTFCATPNSCTSKACGESF